MINEDNIQQQLVGYLQQAFEHARKSAGDGLIVGCGVLTDETGTMFTPVAGVASGGDKDLDPTCWGLEIPYEAVKGGSQILSNFYEECCDYDNDGNWHEEFRTRVYHVLIRSLEQLKSEGFFASFRTDPFLLVWVVDSDIPNIRGRAWVKRLNPPAAHQKYIAWLDRVYETA